MVAAGCFLFGSSARGDADLSSDTDVLIVYEGEPSFSDRQRTKKSVLEQIGRDCAFAEYTWERLASMFADGHLFAWHLYYEARPLRFFKNTGIDFLFPTPAPYKKSKHDSLNFVNLLGSCVRAVEGQTPSIVYEAGLGYVAIRNIGMSLSVLALPRPLFNRHVPFAVAEALQTRPPCAIDIYDLMIAARHSSQRGLPAPSLNPIALLSELIEAHEWAIASLEIAHDLTVV